MPFNERAISSDSAEGARGACVEGLAEDASDFDISDERDLSALLRAESAHFWHLSRNRMIERHLRRIGVRPPQTLLELGCGAGCVSAHLARAGIKVTGVDGHSELLRVAQQRCGPLTLHCHDMRRGLDDLALPRFDAVALFDVLEHLDDPSLLLREAWAKVRPGGYLVGTVPALMALWSKIDEHSGHKLRYSKGGLQALLHPLDTGVGPFAIEVLPFNRLLVPLMWLQRRFVGRGGDAESAAANLSVPPTPVNRALYGMLMAEHFAMRGPLRKTGEGASLWFAVRRPSVRA